ncbi:YqzL family protein [Halobacillus shinanisalinarum]
MSWNVFRQTGNIETYLLMKELEMKGESSEQGYVSAGTGQIEENDGQ